MKMHKPGRESKIMLVLRSALSYFLCLFVGIFCFLPALILAAVLPEKKRRDSKLLFGFLDCAYKGIIKAMLLPVTIEGKENLPKEPAIFVANHESSLDIPMLGSLMNGYPHIWYVLIRFAHTPVLGFFVRRIAVPVDQECAMKASRALISGIRLVDGKDRHTVIFPEGGRFIDGKIHEFFCGFAIIAKKVKRPVIPVMMYNLGKIYPAGSILVHAHPVRVVIGKPFMYQDSETPEQFSERVRSWFVAQAAR
jgi:1-acyl-sn-glycerol-3-phosphate acyltransferase